MFTNKTQELNDLINALIIKNKKLFERLPSEYRNHNVYSKFGELLNAKRFKGPTALDSFFSNNRSSNNMIGLVKMLLTINKKIKTDITRVHNAEIKRKEELKEIIAKSISTPVATPAPTIVSVIPPAPPLPPGPPGAPSAGISVAAQIAAKKAAKKAAKAAALASLKINVFINEADYLQKVIDLDNREIKDIYADLQNVIKDIYDNQANFVNSIGNIMSYVTQDDIKYDDLNKNISELAAAAAPGPALASAAASGPALASAAASGPALAVAPTDKDKLYLVSYALILYIYIIYHFFQTYGQNMNQLNAEDNLIELSKHLPIDGTTILKNIYSLLKSDEGILAKLAKLNKSIGVSIDKYNLQNIVEELPQGKLLDTVFMIHGLDSHLGTKNTSANDINIATVAATVAGLGSSAAAAAATSGSKTGSSGAATSTGTGGPKTGSSGAATSTGTGGPKTGSSGAATKPNLEDYLNNIISGQQIGEIKKDLGNGLVTLMRKGVSLKDKDGKQFPYSVQAIHFSDILINISDPNITDPTIKELLIQSLVQFIYILYHYYTKDYKKIETLFGLNGSPMPSFTDFITNGAMNKYLDKLPILKMINSNLDSPAALSNDKTTYDINFVLDDNICALIRLSIHKAVSAGFNNTFKLLGGGLGKNYDKYMKYKLKYYQLKAQLRIH